MMLEIRDLDAWYGKSQVLRGVALAIGEGEIVALLGRNGAGRSRSASLWWVGRTPSCSTSRPPA